MFRRIGEREKKKTHRSVFNLNPVDIWIERKTACWFVRGIERRELISLAVRVYKSVYLAGIIKLLTFTQVDPKNREINRQVSPQKYGRAGDLILNPYILRKLFTTGLTWINAALSYSAGCHVQNLVFVYILQWYTFKMHWKNRPIFFL